MREYDELIEEYSGFLKQLAILYELQLIDLRYYLTKKLEKYNVENLPHSVISHDGLHLNEFGNRCISEYLVETIRVTD